MLCSYITRTPTFIFILSRKDICLYVADEGEHAAETRQKQCQFMYIYKTNPTTETAANEKTGSRKPKQID